MCNTCQRIINANIFEALFLISYIWELCFIFQNNLYMQVTRQDLLQICDKFLQDEIGKQEVEDYAWELISSDNYEWNDEVIGDILFQWDNEVINFPINKVNMQLWKKRLITGVNDLA